MDQVIPMGSKCPLGGGGLRPLRGGVDADRLTALIRLVLGEDVDGHLRGHDCIPHDPLRLGQAAKPMPLGLWRHCGRGGSGTLGAMVADSKQR